MATPYWTKRLHNRAYTTVVLTLGYPKGGGVPGVTRLEFPYRGYTPVTLTHPHFGPEPVLVYAIPVHLD